MTDTPVPDVRELAKAAVATIRQQARRVWNGGVIMLTSDGEIADAVLAAVTPVIEERAAKEEQERIALAIDAEMVAANWAKTFRNGLEHAAGIARCHSTQPETGQDHG